MQQNPSRIRRLSDHGSRCKVLFVTVMIMAGAVQTINGGTFGVVAYNEISDATNYVQYGTNERKGRKLIKGERRRYRRRLNGESGGHKILKAFQTVVS